MAERLLLLGYDVLVETNGSLPINIVSDKCRRIVDFKYPDSDEARHNDLANIGRLSERDEVKFVISSRKDFNFACELMRQISSQNPRFASAPLLSPNTTKLAPDTLAEWILENGIPARLQLQLHKILWPHSRGR